MPSYDDEIDIRPYILALIRFWWLIALLAVIFIVISEFLNREQPATYTSTATILIPRSRTSLELAQQFPTRIEPIDSNSRMIALTSLAQSDSLAAKVVQSLEDKLPQGLRTPTAIRELVNVTSSGDIILVTVKSEDSELAADLANAWAQQAVNDINAAYSNEQPLTEIQSQLKSAKLEYDNSQSTLEDFIQNNQINILEKRLIEAETLYERLTEERVRKIAYYSDRKQKMEILKVQAEALKKQLQSGNRSQAGDLGDAIAVMMARVNTLRINPDDLPDLPSTQVSNSNAGTESDSELTRQGLRSEGDLILNLQVDGLANVEDSTTNYVADLETLINLSDEEITQASENLKTLTQEVNQNEEYNEIGITANQIRSLMTELEREKSQQKELVAQRDLTWQAYQAIVQKEIELRNAVTTDSQVILASPAIPAQNPSTASNRRNMIITGAVGLMLGIFIVLIIQWWRSINIRQAEREASFRSSSTN